MKKHIYVIMNMLFILVVLVSIVAILKPMRLVPACSEDVVILGSGDFESDGRWDYYVCGPAVDDFIISD